MNWSRTNQGNPISLQLTALTAQPSPQLLTIGIEPIPYKDEVLSPTRLPIPPYEFILKLKRCVKNFESLN